MDDGEEDQRQKAEWEKTRNGGNMGNESFFLLKSEGRR